MNPERYGRHYRHKPGGAAEEPRATWRGEESGGGGGVETARWRQRLQELDERRSRSRSPSPKRSLHHYDRNPDMERNLRITVGNDRYQTDNRARRDAHSRLGPMEQRTAVDRHHEDLPLGRSNWQLDVPRVWKDRQQYSPHKERLPARKAEASRPHGRRAPRALSPDSGYALHRPEEAPLLPAKSILKRRAEPNVSAPQERTTSTTWRDGERSAYEERSWFKGDVVSGRNLAIAEREGTGKSSAAGVNRASSLQPFQNVEDRDTFLDGDDNCYEGGARGPHLDKTNPLQRPPEDYAKLAKILKAISHKNEMGKLDEGGRVVKKFPASSGESGSRVELPPPGPSSPGSRRDMKRKRPEEATEVALRPGLPSHPHPPLPTKLPEYGVYQLHGQQPVYCVGEQPAGEQNPTPAWSRYPPPAPGFATCSLSPVALATKTTPTAVTAPSPEFTNSPKTVVRPNLLVIQTVGNKEVENRATAFGGTKAKTRAKGGHECAVTPSTVPPIDPAAGQQDKEEDEGEKRKVQARMQYLTYEWHKMQDYQDRLKRRFRKAIEGHDNSRLLELSRLQDEAAQKMTRLLAEMNDLPQQYIQDKARKPSIATEQDEGQQGLEEGSSNTFFDSGQHWCKNCNVTCSSLLQFLTHLHSKKHRQTLDPYHRPWFSQQQWRQQKQEGAFQDMRPAKGSEFLMPISGYYCQLCAQFCGDQAFAEEHVISWQHNNKYQKMVLENRVYEPRRALDLQASQAVLAESERRRRKEEIQKLSAENKAKLMKIEEEEKAQLAELDDKCVEHVDLGPKAPIKITVKAKDDRAAPRADSVTPSGVRKEEEGGGTTVEPSHVKEPADSRPPGKTICIKLSAKTLAAPVGQWATSLGSCVTPISTKIKANSPIVPVNLRKVPCAPSFNKPASLDKFISIGSKGADKPLPVIKEDGNKDPSAPPADISEATEAQTVTTASNPVEEQPKMVSKTVPTSNEAGSCTVQQQQEDEEFAPGTQLERDTVLAIPVKPPPVVATGMSTRTHQPSSTERPKSCLATANAKDLYSIFYSHPGAEVGGKMSALSSVEREGRGSAGEVSSAPFLLVDAHEPAVPEQPPSLTPTASVGTNSVTPVL